MVLLVAMIACSALVARGANDSPVPTAAQKAAQAANDVAPWKGVNSGIATIPGIERGVLIQWRGPIGVSAAPTGRLIERFSVADRVAHWTMGLSFVVLALTGLILTAGRRLLLPLAGYESFSSIALACKNIHAFLGPLFMLFWGLVCGFSVVLCASGLILDFPNFAQGRSLMQDATIIHLAIAFLAIAASLFHMYLGTVGVEGAYRAMRDGTVDESWAREHHEIWYDKVKAGKSRQHWVAPSAPLAAVPANDD